MPSNSFLPSNLTPVDSADFNFKFNYMQRHPGGAAYSRFGLLDDPSVLQSRISGPTSAPGGNWGYNTRSGSVRISGARGGKTPSDPGKGNWATLDNAVFNAARGVRGLINTSRTMKRAAEQKKARELEEAQQMEAREWENTQLAYKNAWNPSMDYSYAYQQAAAGQPPIAGQQGTTVAQSANKLLSTSQSLAAGLQASRTPLKQGASSKLPRGGTPKPGFVNLLTGPTALVQPPKKPRAARSTVQKPKATRSAPAVNLNDPSNW